MNRPLIEIADDLDRMEVYDRSNPDGTSPEAVILRAADAVIEAADESADDGIVYGKLRTAVEVYRRACRENERE